MRIAKLIHARPPAKAFSVKWVIHLYVRDFLLMFQLIVTIVVSPHRIMPLNSNAISATVVA